MLLLGTALLAGVVAQTDLSVVGRLLGQIGPWAVLSILGVYGLAHLCLAASWQLTLPGAESTPRWLWRTWRVLMVGSAIESVTPFASLGGEPVKAMLLKRHYGVRLTDASTSLVLTRMTDLVAQVAFISVGLLLMFRGQVLPASYRAGAAAALALFSVGILLFLLLQTRRGFSRLHAWLERGPLGARLSARVVVALDALHEVEDQLVAFYRDRRARFAASSLCALAEWTGNAIALWLAARALGYAVGMGDALVMEAFVALVRSTLFFVPGDVGTQEAAQVLICNAITGSAEAGLALAAIRRARDLLWIAGGLAIGGGYSLAR